MRKPLLALMIALALVPAAQAQRPDSARADTTPTVLAPISVSVSRDQRLLGDLPAAVSAVDSPAIAKARPTWGLDEAMTTVPGVYAANRYNFSLDQRISIRGFGARSSFGIRGIKVLLDGIPQTLADGTGQLTNVDFGAISRMEVLRGSSSALFGNASGGVISMSTDPTPPELVVQELRLTAGTFDRHNLPLFGNSNEQTWSKWQYTSQARVGKGWAGLMLSRMVYSGQRQHSDADFRNINARLALPLGEGLSLSVNTNIGNDPRADNPGALTAAELAANPDSAAAINLTRNAGKDVSQVQGGATLTKRFASGGEAALTLFGFSRDLNNPQTFAYIMLDRHAYGLRASVSRPLTLFGVPQRLTAGLDVQRQHDDRLNVGNNAGVPDTVRQLDQVERVTEIGPFVQTAIPLSARTTLTGGLRFDRVDFAVEDQLVSATNPDDSGNRLMQALSGSLGITRQLSDAVSAYATVGTSFETPTTTELTNRPDTAGGFNATLQPQRAVNFEVGARGRLSHRLGWSVAAYRANVKDALISYQIPSSPGRVFFQNAGRSTNQGLEVGADLATGPLTTTIAWTYSDFSYADYVAFGDTLDGRSLPGIPAHWLKALFQLRPRRAAGVWAEVQVTHSSGFLVSDTLETRNAPWWLTDVRFGWDGNVGSLRLSPFVALSNVWDRKYVSSVVINAANGRYYEPAPGRHGYFGLSIGFGR